MQMKLREGTREKISKGILTEFTVKLLYFYFLIR